jgi:hypothetical protein
MYVSTPDVNGVYKWKKCGSVKRADVDDDDELRRWGWENYDAIVSGKIGPAKKTVKKPVKKTVKKPVKKPVKKVVKKAPAKKTVKKATKKIAKKPVKKIVKVAVTCSKKSTKKYTSRPSPPYAAQECKGARRKGKHGTMYVSAPDVNGTYRWKKCGSAKKTVVAKAKKTVAAKAKKPIAKAKKPIAKPKKPVAKPKKTVAAKAKKTVATKAKKTVAAKAKKPTKSQKNVIMPLGIYSTTQPHFAGVVPFMKQLEKVQRKLFDKNRDGLVDKLHDEYEKVMSPFLLKMSDVKKMVASNIKKWYFIQPQGFNYVNPLTREDLFTVFLPEHKDDTIFYDVGRGIAGTGGGGDYWYKCPPAVIPALKAFVERANKLIKK